MSSKKSLKIIINFTNEFVSVVSLDATNFDRGIHFATIWQEDQKKVYVILDIMYLNFNVPNLMD